MDVAREAWKGDVPDWVEAIVMACDRSSQAKVAGRLGYTAAVVSQVIRNTYRANMRAIEARARAVYLDGSVECPALGTISAETCLRWRDRSTSLTSASPAMVRMFRACADCPRNAKVIEEEDAM